jgi:hypothetical protein
MWPAGSALPIVGDVVDPVVTSTRYRFSHGDRIVSICNDAANFATKRMRGPAMEQGNFMSRIQKPVDQALTDKLRSAYHENAHFVRISYLTSSL